MKTVRPRELSISTSFNYEIPIEEQIPRIAEVGFTHVSLGGREAHSGYLSQPARDRLKRVCAAHALQVDTIHGPGAGQADSTGSLAAAAEAAVDLGARIVVCHGGPFALEEVELPSRLEALMRTCGALDAVSADTGVVFALENVLPGPATDLIRRALPLLNPEHFGFCYDSAHDQIGGPRPFDLLAEMPERVRAVHLSDRVREHVDHLLPGEGFIDWQALSVALRASAFAGPLLLEVSVLHSHEKETGRFLQRAYACGCEIYDQVFGAEAPFTAEGSESRA